MSLACGRERLLHAQVNLHAIRNVPPPTPYFQMAWLWHSLKAENITIEAIGCTLLARRHGELNMIQTHYEYFIPVHMAPLYLRHLAQFSSALADVALHLGGAIVEFAHPFYREWNVTKPGLDSFRDRFIDMTQVRHTKTWNPSDYKI